MSGKVMVTTEYDATELWSMIMGAGWETWDRWVELDYVGGDWDKPCMLRVTAWGEDQGEDQGENPELYVIRDITIDDVVAALDALRAVPIVREHLSNEDFDAVSSDCVIQQIVYGEIVYS